MAWYIKIKEKELTSNGVNLTFELRRDTPAITVLYNKSYKDGNISLSEIKADARIYIERYERLESVNTELENYLNDEYEV